MEQHHILATLNNYFVFINVIFACVVIFFERKRPVFTLLWVNILLLTPYFGFIFYLFFGLRFKKRRELEKYYLKDEKGTFKKSLSEKCKINIQKWGTLSRYLDSVLMGGMTFNNELKFFFKPQEYFDNLIEKISNAKRSIYMEYYIFDDDEVGKPIYNLLIEKAKEGLEIKIIADGMGTRKLKRRRIKTLKDVGIKFEIFFPSYFPFTKLGNIRANYRDHRKITIVDNKYCFSGGINIGIDYVGKGKLGNWQDLGFMIQGEALIDYLHEFERNWKFLKRETKKEGQEEEIVRVGIYETIPMQVISSGPNYEFHTVKDTYIDLILRAEKSIHIQTPYFVPDESTLDALRRALMSGVEVKITIPGCVEGSWAVYWANQYFYGELLELGAKIYKYKEGFIHSKLVVIDGEVAFLGTANFDYRSMYQNFEINILLFGKKVLELEGQIERDIEKSNEVSLELYRKRARWERFLESISKLVAPIL